MSETIGFVGVGMQGGAIARLSADAGYQVLVSNSRGPETLTDLVAELGEKARAVTAREAIESSDIVVLSVPMSSCKSLPMDAFAGKIVVDTLNYYPERDGTIEELESPALTSGEYLQREMPKGRIVKTLNNVDFVHLYGQARPEGSAERSALPIAADDPEARAVVAAFVERIGYDTVDVGTLAESWRFEPGTPVYVWPYVGEPPAGMTVEQARNTWYHKNPGTTVTREKVRELIDSAEKGPGIGMYDHLPFSAVAMSDL